MRYTLLKTILFLCLFSTTNLFAELVKINLSPRFQAYRYSKLYLDDPNISPMDTLEARIKNMLYPITNTPPQFYSLKKADIVDNRITSHIRFTISVEGLAIDNLSIGVHLLDEEILHVNGSGLLNLDTFNYPKDFVISEEEAKTIVANEFLTSEFETFEISKKYYYFEEDMYLTYKVQFTSPRLIISAWELFINAENGQIMSKRSLLSHAVGRGRVYPQNKKKTPKIVEVDLPNLVDQQPFLTGKYAQVVNLAPGYRKGAQSADHQFLYDDTDSRFAEVSTYYYADQFLTWLDTFELNIDMHVKYDVHVPNPNTGGKWNNANYNPANKTIQIGDGDGKFLQNLSIDSDVIMHETGHHIIFNYGGITSLTGESGAIHEGVADFLTFHFNDDPCLGESAIANGNPCIRSAENSLTYPEGLNSDVHGSGDIWSAALWQTRQKIAEDSREDYAELIIRSLAFILNPRADFEDASNAIILTDKTHFNSTFKCIIARNFMSRGFGFTTKEVSIKDCNIDEKTVVQVAKIQEEMADKKDEEEGKEEEEEKAEGCAFSIDGDSTSRKQPYAPLLLVLLLIVPMMLKSNRTQQGPRNS